MILEGSVSDCCSHTCNSGCGYGVVWLRMLRPTPDHRSSTVRPPDSATATVLEQVRRPSVSKTGSCLRGFKSFQKTGWAQLEVPRTRSDRKDGNGGDLGHENGIHLVGATIPAKTILEG